MSNPRSRTKPPSDTSPEISTTSASMGRETLVAIAEDEADQARAMMNQKRRAAAAPRTLPPAAPRSGPVPPASSSRSGPIPPTSSPRSGPVPPVSSSRSGPVPPISAPRAAASRMQVNTPAPPSSVAFDPSGRSQFSTMDYQETPPRGGRRESSEPVIETGLQPMGRETLAAITTDLAQELLKAFSSEERTLWLNQIDDAMVLEPFRFEVRGVPMLARPNDTLRREFVALKLLHRLPVRTISEVTRIDVTPTADDALTLTLWVKIPESGG